MAASKSKTAKNRPSSPLGRLGLIAVPGEELEKNRQRLISLKHEVAELRENLRDAELTSSSLTATSAELARCKKELGQSQERILGQEKEILHLTSTLNKLEWEARRHDTDRDDLEHHLDKVRNDLKEKEARALDFVEAKQEAEERAARMEAAVSRSSEQLRRAEADLRERDARLQQMGERVAALERECAEIRVARDAALAARDLADATSAATQRQLSAQQVAHRRELDERRAVALAERTEFERRIASLEEDHRRRAVAASAEVEKRLAEVEARAGARLAAAGADVAARVAEAEAERKLQVAALERFGKDRDAEFTTRASQLSAQWEGRLAAIEDELRMERERSKTLRLAAQNAENRMQAQARESRAQLADLASRLDAALQRGAELDAVRARADVAVAELKERLKAAEVARETADSAVQDLNQRLRASQQTCQEKARAKAEAEDRVLHLETRALPGLKSELAETAALLRSTQKQSTEAAESAERINAMLRKSLKEGDARLAEAYHRIAELEAQLRATPINLSTRQLVSGTTLADSFRSPLRSPREASLGGPPAGLSGGVPSGTTPSYFDRHETGMGHGLRVSTPPPLHTTPPPPHTTPPFTSHAFDRQIPGVGAVESSTWQSHKPRPWDDLWSSKTHRGDGESHRSYDSTSSSFASRYRNLEHTTSSYPASPLNSLHSRQHQGYKDHHGSAESLWKRVEKKCEELNKGLPRGATIF